MAISGLLIGLGILVIAVIVGFNYLGDYLHSNSSSTTRYSSPGLYDDDITIPVAYHISGSASQVSLTYINASGGTEQIAAVRLPWEKTFYMHYGDFVYISAQNLGKSGSVIAEIRIDGTVWEQSVSEGAYVIATSSGTLSGE